MMYPFGGRQAPGGNQMQIVAYKLEGIFHPLATPTRPSLGLDQVTVTVNPCINGLTLIKL